MYEVRILKPNGELKRTIPRETLVAVNHAQMTAALASGKSGQVFREVFEGRRALKKCRRCGRGFVPLKKSQVNCSTFCKAPKEVKALDPRVCRWCGNEYAPFSAKQKYCSRSCREKWTNRTWSQKRAKAKTK